MATCTGRGPDGQHCCQVGGSVCQFYDGGCSLYDLWGHLTELPEWQESPIGRWFATNHPGFECRDWPQSIPAVMADPGVGKCCYERMAA
jgi:hypothetical protein